MDSMQKAMLIIVFFLGVALVIVWVVALFKHFSGGEGKLKILGMELSGTGAPAIFLVVGVALLLSSVAWYGSINRVATLTAANTNVTQDRDQYLDAAAKVLVQQQETEAQCRQLTTTTTTSTAPPVIRISPRFQVSPALADKLKVRAAEIKRVPPSN